MLKHRPGVLELYLLIHSFVLNFDHNFPPSIIFCTGEVLPFLSLFIDNVPCVL